VSSCEHGNEISGFVECGELHYAVTQWRLLTVIYNILIDVLQVCLLYKKSMQIIRDITRTMYRKHIIVKHSRYENQCY
jgi:hypothetical protein